MRIVEDGLYTELDIFNKDKVIESKFYFFFAQSGWGKTLSVESLLETYHKQGFTIVCLADVKDTWELGFSMFKPVKKYHLRRLKKDRIEPSSKKVKLYHPFTFNLPKIKIPEINFYGFSLKDLGREEYSMILESAWESETTRLLIDASNSVSNSVGLHGFLNYIQDRVMREKAGGESTPDWDNFGLKVAGGTTKSLVEVGSHFKPFQKDYFLVPDNSEIKLNWEEIIKDNEHYHVFGTSYIKDEKLKEFCVMALLNSIIKAQKKLRKPLLIYIPEIRYLVPARPQGYKFFLARSIKENLSIIRSLNISFVGDSQCWSDVEDEVKNSATMTFFGQIGGGKDFNNITKAVKYTREQFKSLLQMDIDEMQRPSFMIQNNPEIGLFTPKFPSHCHAEEGYIFEKMYQQSGKEMKSYIPLIDEMKDLFVSDEQKIRKRFEEKQAEEKEKKEKKKEEKEKSKEGKQSLEKKEEEIKKKGQDVKLNLMKLIYEMRNDESLDEKERSYRKIAEKFNGLGIKTHTTAKKYCEDYKKHLADKKQQDDFPGINGAEENLDPEVKSNYNEVKKEIYESSEIPED